MSMHSQDILEAMDGIAILMDRDLIVRHIGRRNWNSFWTANGGVTDSTDVRSTVAPVQSGARTEYLLYQSTVLAVGQRPAMPLFGARAVGSTLPNALKVRRMDRAAGILSARRFGERSAISRFLLALL